MDEFDRQAFCRLLREAPSKKTLIRPSKHSEYLQKYVFDPLMKQGSFDLKGLDFEAFTLEDATPEDYGLQHEKIACNWVEMLNHLLRNMAAAPLTQRTFF